MWVKICGNTQLEDCLHAASAGADAVGFVFAAGKRTVTPEQVAAITLHLPNGLERIGVFTVQDAFEISAAAVAAGLTGIQLHSSYEPALLEAVRNATPPAHCTRLMQVLHWDVAAEAAVQQERLARQLQAVAADGFADTILIDSQSSRGSGGTGRSFDWEAAAEVLQASPLRIVIAGGLKPANVGDAVRTLQPWGVDVSSGVEQAPGIKDREAVRAFIEKARAAQ